MNGDPSHTENLPFELVYKLVLGLSELASHASSDFGDQSLRPLNIFHAPTETMIQTDGFRWAGRTLGSPNTVIMTLQKGAFSLMKKSGIPAFRR